MLVPSAISVNMFRLRRTSETAPRSKNGQPAQTTTGVDRRSSIHCSGRAATTCASGRPGIISAMPRNTTRTVGAIDAQNLRVRSASLGLGGSSSVTARGSRAIPQMGQLPGPGERTPGGMGQVNSAPGAGGAWTRS